MLDWLTGLYEADGTFGKIGDGNQIYFCFSSFEREIAFALKKYFNLGCIVPYDN